MNLRAYRPSPRRSVPSRTQCRWNLKRTASLLFGIIPLVSLLLIFNHIILREQTALASNSATKTPTPVPLDVGITQAMTVTAETPPTPNKAERQIVGGKPAVPGAWPWMVSVQTFTTPDYVYFCGGALVAPNWVLTAAHCVINSMPNQIITTIGIHRLGSNQGQLLEVDRIVVHPLYGYDFTHDFAHDIALLHLSQPADADPVAPLTAATLELAAPGTVATVIGWGALSEEGREGWLSYDLHQVQVPIVSQEECNTSMGRMVSENMLCAGYSEGGKDACHGDSGGPLVVPDGNGGWLLTGIVSFGIGCARPAFYGVYTRVSQYNDWLLQHISEMETVYLPIAMQSEAVATPQPATMPQPTATPQPTAMPQPTATPQPTAMPDGVIRRAQVPILMYHYVSEPPPEADIYRVDLSVSPRRFASHLQAMAAAGYTTISMYDLLAHLTQGAPLPPKPVVLTFDDGYRDNYENAFPLLQELGMIATFFVVTDFIDSENPAYLTWEMARAMQAAGMRIESHGRDHTSLQNRKDDYLIWQALGSAETIEFEIGVRPRIITYPFGRYDENTIRIFKSAGFWAGVTVRAGATHMTDDLFQLKRVRVRGTTTAADLLRLLELDW